MIKTKKVTERMYSSMIYTTFTCVKLYYHDMFRPEMGHCQVGNIKLEISMKLENIKAQNRGNQEDMFLEVSSLLGHIISR